MQITKTLRFFLLLCLLSLFQFLGAQSGPVYVITNGSFSTSGDFWVVDTDSLRGNYAAGSTTMTIHSTTGQPLGIHVDSSYLREDMDYLRIYDGPSTSSPLLSTITRSDWSDAGFKSSGPVITVAFRAYPFTAGPSIYGWRLKISSVKSVQDTAHFLPIFQGLRTGNIQLNDYDRDGDKDVLMGGVIYRNDSRDDSLYVFDRILKPLGNWRSCNAVVADFDNDGQKDVFITGESDAGGIFTRRATIYKNNNGIFTSIPSLPFIPATQGAVSVLDFNNDGKPDIAYSGHTGSEYVFKLYLNNGGFSFTEKTLNLPGWINASMSWKDYDDDGDLDLLYNGRTATTQPATGLFVNNNGSFSHVNMIMFSTSYGEIGWADLNKDGKWDIVNSGVSSTGTETPEILFNNGNGQFTRVITNLTRRSSTHFDWADYDNDGDLDALYSGLLSTTTIFEDAAVYKNNGNGNFSKIPLAGANTLATLKWVDVNKDGVLDVFVSGRRSSPGMFYKKMGLDSFQACSYPFTSFEGVGTALVEDFTNDGTVDVLYAGNVEDQDCNEGNSSVLIKSFGWRLHPTAILTPVADLTTSLPVQSFASYFWRWGDVDSDGFDDVLLATYPYASAFIDTFRVFRNVSNTGFSLLYKGNPIPTQLLGDAGVVDVDGDGKNELFMVPNKLFQWNGSGFTLLYSETNGYCHQDGCFKTYVDFADWNGDGRMDVAYAASNSVYILRNNGNGQFVREGQRKSILGELQFIRWDDFDKDGDPDLLTSNGIYENTNYGGFRYRDADIRKQTQTGIADLNCDGWPDIFALQHHGNDGPARFYYSQQGKFFFEGKRPPGFANVTAGLMYQGAEAFDIDNDGDNDILHSLAIGCSFSGIYLNQRNLQQPNILLRSPIGKKSLAIGSTQTVAWIGNDIGSLVTIELSQDSGTTWTLIASNVPSTKYGGRYTWSTAGLAPSQRCLLKITDNSNPALTARSIQTFALVTTTGLPAITDHKGLKLYPNPLQGLLYLDVSEASWLGKKATVKIVDVNGRCLLNRNVVMQRRNMIADGQSLSRGVYFVELAFAQQRFVEKVVRF